MVTWTSTLLIAMFPFLTCMFTYVDTNSLFGARFWFLTNLWHMKPQIVFYPWSGLLKQEIGKTFRFTSKGGVFSDAHHQ